MGGTIIYRCRRCGGYLKTGWEASAKCSGEGIDEHDTAEECINELQERIIELERRVGIRSGK